MSAWRDVDRWHSLRPLPDGGAVTIALMQVGDGITGMGWMIWRRFPESERRVSEILAGPFDDHLVAYRRADELHAEISRRLEAP